MNLTLIASEIKYYQYIFILALIAKYLYRLISINLASLIEVNRRLNITVGIVVLILNAS